MALQPKLATVPLYHTTSCPKLATVPQYCTAFCPTVAHVQSQISLAVSPVIIKITCLKTFQRKTEDIISTSL